MDLKSFLSTKPIFSELDRRVYIFSGKKYCQLFFERFINYCKKQGGQIHSLDLSLMTINQIKMHLSTAFLGSYCWYWLGDISDWSESDQRDVLNCFLTYTGQHHIICFVNEGIIEKIHIQSNLIIETPSYCDQFLFQQLYALGDTKHTTIAKEFIKKAYSKNSSCSLQQACLLLNYADIVSRPMYQEFFDTWIDRIAFPEKSLFTLSGRFFSGQAKLFFKLWHTMKDDYPSAFWISFWSDQLFRAVLYGKYMRTHDALRAKKASYRLPFSFTKQDWKRFSEKKLINLHDELYRLDYQLKNGAREQRIEQFMIRYFAMN